MAIEIEIIDKTSPVIRQIENNEILWMETLGIAQVT